MNFTAWMIFCPVWMTLVRFCCLSVPNRACRCSTPSERLDLLEILDEPWLRYSRLAVLAASASPLASRDWFLQFHAKACIRFTPPIRRLPSAQYPGIRQIYPRGCERLWFWQCLKPFRRVSEGLLPLVSRMLTCPNFIRTFDPTLTTTPFRSSLD